MLNFCLLIVAVVLLFVFWIPIVRGVIIIIMYVTGDSGIIHQFHAWVKSFFKR